MTGTNSQGVVISYKYIQYVLFNYITIPDIEDLTKIIRNATYMQLISYMQFKMEWCCLIIESGKTFVSSRLIILRFIIVDIFDS